MKKVIAFAVAAFILIALCVPAFAADPAKIVGAEELYEALDESSNPSVAMELDEEDGVKFVNFTVTSNNDPWLQFNPVLAVGSANKYVSIRYRTSNTEVASIDLYVKINEPHAIAQGIVADGEWHNAVADLSEGGAGNHWDNDNPDGTIARFDMMAGTGTDWAIDIAFLAFFDNEADAKAFTVPSQGAAPVTEDEPAGTANVVDFDSEESYQIGMSLDLIEWNGAALNQTADGKARANLDTYAGEDGSFDIAKYAGETISYSGWAVFRKAIAGFGYAINDKLVFDDSFTVAPEAGLAEAVGKIFPGEDCSGVLRFKVTVPIKELEGSNTVCAVVKLDDGTVVRLNSATTYDRNTQVVLTGAEAPAPTDEPQPRTGDAAVAMIAVIAVLAMGAAVVFAKKRSF